MSMLKTLEDLGYANIEELNKEEIENDDLEAKRPYE